MDVNLSIAKKNDQGIIKEVCGKIYSNYQVKQVIIFNEEEGNDVDLLVIFEKDQPIEFINDLTVGLKRFHRYDIIYVGEESFDRMLAFLEPLATEPILTGRVIYGSAIKQVKEKTLSRWSDQAVVKNILCLAIGFYHLAIIDYVAHKYKRSIKNLSVAVSYLYFGRHYKERHRVITMKKLINEHPDSLLTAVLSLKKQEYFPTDLLVGLLNQVKEMLPDESIIIS